MISESDRTRIEQSRSKRYEPDDDEEEDTLTRDDVMLARWEADRDSGEADRDSGD